MMKIFKQNNFSKKINEWSSNTKKIKSYNKLIFVKKKLIKLIKDNSILYLSLLI